MNVSARGSNPFQTERPDWEEAEEEEVQSFLQETEGNVKTRSIARSKRQSPRRFALLAALLVFFLVGALIGRSVGGSGGQGGRVGQQGDGAEASFDDGQDPDDPVELDTDDYEDFPDDFGSSNTSATESSAVAQTEDRTAEKSEKPEGTQAPSEETQVPSTQSEALDVEETFAEGAPQQTDAPVASNQQSSTTRDDSYDGAPIANYMIPEGFKKTAHAISETYLPRGKPVSDKARNNLEKKWGAWKLDLSRPDVPLPLFPNGDVPRSDFPANAWQTNTTYLSQWLPEAIALTERAMEAMLAEYGQSKFDDSASENRRFMYNLTISENRQPGSKPSYDMKHPIGNAGYASKASLVALRKRLLHSVMTEDDFVFVMGGHSAAAGHGNHFQQSYTLQVQRVLEPVFERLGVHFVTHNFGMGGLGTLQNAMAARDMYGPKMDVLIWDSSMTEGDAPSKDIFARAAFLSGDKVPVLWGEPDNALYDSQIPGAGSINTGMWGTGMAGVPETTSAVQVETLPWAAQYVHCDKEATQLCKETRYNGTCWIERTDVTPATKQKAMPGGQASWHPGNRIHQLFSRLIAYQFVQQLHLGLTEWYNTEDYVLLDEAWHLTDDFERVRRGVLAVKDSPCYNLNLPDRICELTLHARSEFTPRYNPAETSIRTIIKEGVYVPEPQPNLYDPPEPRLKAFDAPYGEIDILNILENGVEFQPSRSRKEYVEGKRRPGRQLQRATITSTLEPGQGWGLNTKSAPDNCDGTWDSFCGRGADNDCLLSGHNDNRGGLLFDSLSGWMILNLEKVQHGIILIRVEDWIGPGKNERTEGWVCENNKSNCSKAKSNNDRHTRRLENSNKCDHYTFEFAIDGKITTWNHDEWEKERRQVQRVVHLWKLLDDEDFGEERDVEVAIRLTGCDRDSTFLLSHVYWA